jgi:hypothetical protein
MQMNLRPLQTFNRRMAIALTVIFLGNPFVLAGPQPTNSLPATIITTDGVTYNKVKLTRVEPDGLLVEYQPAAGGTGLAKLKFAKLPGSLQKQFGYDPGKAANYEQEEKQAMVALTQKLQHDEKVRAAAMMVQDDTPSRPSLAGAVVVNSSDPTATYAYYTPDQRPAKLDASGLQNAVSSCEHQYECHADFDFRVMQSAAGQPLHFSIDKITISLGLSCQFTLPQTPYDQVKIHEEGHRKIFEYFYTLGPKVATRIGESMIGKEFTSRESNFETAKATAIREAGAQVETQYVTRLDGVAKQASHYYNELTERGLSNIDRGQAAQEAIDKFAKELQN